MEIRLQYFDGCPNWQTTAERLQTILDEGRRASVVHELIPDHAAAEARRFTGSPTVLIDGVDPFPDDSRPIGLSCRVYRTENGLKGSPSLEQLRKAIDEAE